MKRISTTPYYMVVCMLLFSTQSVHAWNPFSADDWNDLGGTIATSLSDAAVWFGDQVVAGWQEIEKIGSWVGDQAKKAYEEAKSASETVYNVALAPAGDFLQEAGNQVVIATQKGIEIIVDRFKDTKVTRSIDYYTRLGALTAAQQIATGVLKAAQTTASATLMTAREVASGALMGVEGFLSEVAAPLASGVLKGSAEAAKGILEGAKQASVGVLEGGKWVVNNVLGQFDINKIHYDGNLRDFASGILGNVAVEGQLPVIINPPDGKFSLETSLNLNNLLDSLKPIFNKIVDDLKSVFVDPFTPKIKVVEKNKKEIDGIARTLSVMKAPAESIYQLEGLSKALDSWQIASGFQEEVKKAKGKADAARKEVLTPEAFLKLSPQEKIAQANKLDPVIKQQMIATNLELLKKNKICPGAYLENITIEGLDLSQSILQGAVILNATFNNVNFSSAIFSGAMIVNSTMNKCNFAGAKFDSACIASTTAQRQTTIMGTNFSGASFYQTRLNARFLGCRFDELQGVGAELKLSLFRGCSFVKANLQWMEAEMVVFDGRANLMQADIRNAILIEVDLSQALMTQAHLENATLVCCRLSMALADGISLQGTNFLFGVSLRGANLAKAAVSVDTNWQGANLCGALLPDGKVNNDDCNKKFLMHLWNLESDTQIVEENRNKLLKTKKCVGGMLQGADLRGRDLSGADLSKSWLVKADLRGTNLRNANLTGTRLQGAKIDSGTYFDGARFCRTLMPNGSWRNDHCGKADEQSVGMTIGAVSEAENNKKKLLATKSCPDCDLRGLQLTELLLAQANLKGADLLGAQLTGTNLSGAILENANLETANFDAADLTRATLIGARAKNSSFKNAILGGCNLSNAHLVKVNFENADLHGSVFRNANLAEANLTNVDIEGADFTNANLVGSVLKPRVMNGKTMDARAIFCNTTMPDGTINNRDCKVAVAQVPEAPVISGVEQNKKKLLATKKCPGCDLNNSSLERAELGGADLSNAQLQGAKLNGARLTQANLNQANLNEAVLTEARLIKAQLNGARLQKAVLKEVDLSKATLIGAELGGADLTNANLTDANLKDANLTGALLDGAIFCRTIMPDGKENNKDCR